jgi:hypothetical protein
MSSSEVAQQVSALNKDFANLERRLAEAERAGARLEQAALTMSRALQEISRHWDAVYEAMRREETVSEDEVEGRS